MRIRRLRFLLGPAVGLVILYLFEVGLRIAGVQPAYRSEAMGGWRMTPNQHQQVKGPRDGHAFLVSTNAEGLRTTLPKERGERPRVALMGDSTVFGWGVDDGNAVSDGLAAALGPDVEVLNAGQPGYTTTQAAWLFGEVVAAWKPDRVVMFIPMHDFNKVLISDREHLEGGASWAADARVLLAGHSRIYQVLRQSIWPLTDQAFILPNQATDEPRVERVSDAERTRAFDDVRARLAEWGGELLVGMLPFHADLIGRATNRPGEEHARAYTTTNGLLLADLRACCGTNSGGLVLPDDPGHLGAEGNRRVGEALAPIVRKSLE